MADTCFEEPLSDLSSDEYEREQLEIALYSQIHFEENDLPVETYNDDNNNKDFVIDVKGNEKKGFVAGETNASIILNREIDKIYENLSDIKDISDRKKSLVDTNTNLEAKKVKTLPGKTASNYVKKAKKYDHARQEIDQAKKIKTLLRDSSSPLQKRGNVEKMILGTESDNDDSDDEDIVMVSSDDDDYDDEDALYVSDSDLDSLDVILGQSDSESGDIQMNVHAKPRYTYRKMQHEDSGLFEDEDNADDADHWAISREDSFMGIKKAARYYKPVRCHNCNFVGHLSKNCPQPKKVIVCSMCSEPGHICRNCPQGMCYNCEEPGHESKTCRAPRRNLNSACYRCNMHGHDQFQCPDVWRQYHVTVTPGKIQKFPVHQLQKSPSCYNCGEEGHLGYECEDERMNRFLRVCTPFICRYNSEAQIKQMERRFDDGEDRPLKRSRSDSWLESRGYRSKEEKMDRNFEYDVDFGLKKYSGRDRVTEKGGPSKIDLKKPSPFVHLVKQRPDSRTGRNNFDKLQFTVLNEKRHDHSQEKESIGSTETTERKKSKKRKKRKKDKKLEKCETQSCDIPVQDSNLKVIGSSSQVEGNRNDNQEASHQNFNRFSKKRKIKDSSFGTNVEDRVDRDFSEVFDTRGNEKSFENKPTVRTVTFNQNRTISQNWGKRGKGKTGMIDFTVSTDIGSTKVDRLDRTQMKYSSERNDNLRPDDLFSLQKIKKLQSGSDLGLLGMEEDVEHDISATTSQKKRRKRNRKKKGKTAD